MWQLRIVGIIICILLVLGVTGCLSTDSAPSAPQPTAVGTPTWEELKAQSRTIGYKELSGNSDQHIGQHFYFRGRVIQVIERGERAYNLRVDVEPDAPGDAIVYVTHLLDYTGQPLLEDDQVEFVGIASGVEYDSVVGQSVTIPKIKAVAVISSSGDVRWYSRDSRDFRTTQSLPTTGPNRLSSTAAPDIVTLTPTTPVPPTPYTGATATPQPTVIPAATVPPCTNAIAVPNPQDNPDLVADCKALLQARDRLAGSATLNWSGDRAITYWDGIIIGGEPLRVTTMVLSDRKLSGTIPPELAALTNLQELDLHSNQLTGPIPHQLGTLTNLQGLWLYSNQLTGPIPPQLAALAKLRELSLRDNQLSGSIPPQLGALTNLQGLWLYNNQLTGSIPPQLGAIASLQVLDLRNNQLSDTIPPQLGMLANLQGLGISGNRLSGNVPPQLASLTNLQGLWLAGNALTGCLPEGLRGVATNDFANLPIPFCAAAVAASPTSQPPTVTVAALVSPTAQPTATMQPEPVARTVYVGNTDGDGVSLRRTRNLADRIAAYPDNTQLVVLGPDTSENGITWKHVRTPDGKVGYVPAQYTVPELPATPTAVPTPTVPSRPAPNVASPGEVRVPSNFVSCERLRAHKSMLWGQAPSLIYSGDPRVSGRIQPGDFIRILTPTSDSNGNVRVIVYPHDYRTVGQSDGKVWINWWGLVRINWEHVMFKCEDS